MSTVGSEEFLSICGNEKGLVPAEKWADVHLAPSTQFSAIACPMCVDLGREFAVLKAQSAHSLLRCDGKHVFASTYAMVATPSLLGTEKPRHR